MLNGKQANGVTLYEIFVDYCESNPCINGGNCTIDLGNQPNGFRCNCPELFTGERCESRLNSLCDVRAEEACGGVQKCVEDIVNYRFQCICDPGFELSGENSFHQRIQTSCSHFITIHFILLKFTYLKLSNLF